MAPENSVRVVTGDPKEVFEFVRSEQSVFDLNTLMFGHRRIGIALLGAVELRDFRETDLGDTNFLIAVLRLLLFLRHEFAVAELQCPPQTEGSCAPGIPQGQPLNLCAQTSGCSQNTENGITTVTVVSKDPSVTPNKAGSVTITSSTTTQTYTFNQAGIMIGGHQETVGTQLTIGADGTQSTKPIDTSSQLTLGNAMHQLGTQAVDMFQSSFADTRGTMARFPGTVAADAEAHPREYALKAVDVGLLFAWRKKWRDSS